MQQKLSQEVDYALSSGMFHSALPVLYKALFFNSLNKEILYSLGMLHDHMGRVSKYGVIKKLHYFLAKLYYKKLIKKYPKEIDGYIGMSRLYGFKNNPNLTEKYLLLALKIDENNSRTLNAYANFLKQSGKLEEAINYYQRSISYEGSHFGTYLNLAKLYLEINNLDEASKYFNQAKEKMPNNLGELEQSVIKELEAELKNMPNTRQKLTPNKSHARII